MKYDLSKKSTIATRRMLNAVYEAIFSLLAVKAFDDISVLELCEKSMIPRATFYNYFDDKYDLLSYCWLILKNHIAPAQKQSDEEHDEIELIMMNMVDYLDRNRTAFNRILQHNAVNQYLFIDLRVFLVNELIAAFSRCSNNWYSKIPFEMVARLYANTVLIVLEWKYVDKHECTKEEMLQYLHFLINKDHLA